MIQQATDTTVLISTGDAPEDASAHVTLTADGLVAVEVQENDGDDFTPASWAALTLRTKGQAMELIAAVAALAVTLPDTDPRGDDLMAVADAVRLAEQGQAVDLPEFDRRPLTLVGVADR